MKKNNALRIATVVLALVLVTSCFVGGTFAKYVSTATVTDNARVAYWGWGKAAAIEFDLFSDTYDAADADDKTVDSEDGDNVIAPGTEQTATFGFAYVANVNDVIAAPEVDYTFDVDFAITGDYDALDAIDSFYWTLDSTRYDSVAELTAAVQALDGAAGDAAQTYQANALPTGFEVDDTHTIGWAWDFESAETDNAADTALGNMDALENVTVTITVTATQVGD